MKFLLCRMFFIVGGDHFSRDLQIRLEVDRVLDVNDDIDAFRQGLELWFDDSMARVSGWYKRQAQLILCGIAVVVVAAVNANTLTIGERL